MEGWPHSKLAAAASARSQRRMQSLQSLLAAARTHEGASAGPSSRGGAKESAYAPGSRRATRGYCTPHPRTHVPRPGAHPAPSARAFRRVPAHLLTAKRVARKECSAFRSSCATSETRGCDLHPNEDVFRAAGAGLPSSTRARFLSASEASTPPPIRRASRRQLDAHRQAPAAQRCAGLALGAKEEKAFLLPLPLLC